MATRWWRKVVAGNVVSWEWQNGTWERGPQFFGNLFFGSSNHHGPKTWMFRGPDDLSGKMVELWIHPGIAVFFFYLHPDPWLTGNLFLCIVHIYQLSGGLKKTPFIFTPKIGEMIQFDYMIFFKGFEPTNQLACSFFCVLLRRHIWAFFWNPWILKNWCATMTQFPFYCPGNEHVP